MKIPVVAALVGLLVIGVACSPAPSQPDISAQAPSDTLVPSSQDPALPGSEGTGGAPGEVITHAVTSDSGVKLDLPRVTFGTQCLTLSISLSGKQLPSEGAAGEAPKVPMVDAVVLYEGSVLEMQPRLGGGGGGGGGDGSFQMSQETVYEMDSPLPSSAPFPLTVDLTIDETYGFDSPLHFAVQAEPNSSSRCGLPEVTPP
jgi:hypothetical protein